MAKSDYRIGDGTNLSLVSLAKFNPQPRSIGVKATRRTYYAGAAFDEGLYVELLWSVFESIADYQFVLNQAGVLSAVSNVCTIYCRDQVWNYHRYNGVAFQPLIGEQADWNYFPQGVTMLIRDLEFIA